MDPQNGQAKTAVAIDWLVAIMNLIGNRLIVAIQKAIVTSVRETAETHISSVGVIPFLNKIAKPNF